MGLHLNGLRFLLYAKSVGVDFTKTAFIGRQGLHLSFNQFCNVLTSEFNYDVDPKTLKAIYNPYADALLRYLGAEEVDSFDYADYEGATHIHDFNKAIPKEYHGQYTTIIEGGTLEHIFNFPTAIKNCMQMIKTGGHYLGISPANNYMGHGFYQVSPELYFRVFCEDNGFRAEHVILHEGRETKQWFSVVDPENVKSRGAFLNATPTLLLILATRLADCPIFSTPPLQSYYVSTWKGLDAKGRVSVVQKTLSILKPLIPRSVKNRIKVFLGARHDRAFFKPFNPFPFS